MNKTEVCEYCGRPKPREKRVSDKAWRELTGQEGVVVILPCPCNEMIVVNGRQMIVDVKTGEPLK